MKINISSEAVYQLTTLHMCLTDYERTGGKTGFGDIPAKLKAVSEILEQTKEPPDIEALRKENEELKRRLNAIRNLA